MEQTYATPRKTCELIKTRPDTLKFLLDYSQALSVIKYKGLIFDNNQN